MWAFVPSAGGILADWGAEVIKIEAPTGDPIRGLVSGGVGKTDGITYTWELFNRGKHGIALDLNAETAQKIVYQLAETADVFLTSLLPRARKKLKIDHDDISRRQPADHLAVGSGRGRTRTRGREGRLRLDQLLFVARLGLVLCHAERPRSGRHAHGRIRRFAQRHGARGWNRCRAGAQGEDRRGLARRRVVASAPRCGRCRWGSWAPRWRASTRCPKVIALGPESAREHLSERRMAVGSRSACCNPTCTGPTSAWRSAGKT